MSDIVTMLWNVLYILGMLYVLGCNVNMKRSCSSRVKGADKNGAKLGMKNVK